MATSGYSNNDYLMCFDGEIREQIITALMPYPHAIISSVEIPRYRTVIRMEVQLVYPDATIPRSGTSITLETAPPVRITLYPPEYLEIATPEPWEYAAS